MSHVIEVPHHGGPEVLRSATRSVGQPGEDEARVAVHTAGVNFADVLARLGVYAAAPSPPFVPGIEIAGRIEAVGSRVEVLRPGDRVCGFCPFGGYGERVVTPARYLLPIPPEMGLAVAATLPVQYLTAWYAVEHLARLEAGERVLIPAAAGGVGRAAVELSRAAGARVVAIVGSAAKAAVVHEVDPGARVVVAARGDLGAAGDQRFDAVLDGVGGRTFGAAWRRLEPGGRYVLFGAAAAVTPGRLSRLVALWRLLPMLAVRPLSMITDNRSLCAFNLFFLADRRTALLRRAMADLFDRAQAGRIRPKIGLALPLAAAVEAHRALQERRTVGKVLLRVADDRAAVSGHGGSLLDRDSL